MLTDFRGRANQGFGNFHARLRFARSTIPEGKWGLLVVYALFSQRISSKAWALSVVPHFSLSPPRIAFLASGDFHARLLFTRSTIPEENGGLYS